MIRGPRNVADYRTDDHQYRDPLDGCGIADAYDGEPLPSVTTILGDTFPAFLDTWKLGLAADHAIDNVDHIIAARAGKAKAGEALRTVAEVRADIIGAPDRHRDAAAARGTDVHRLLETMLDGGQLTTYDETSPAWPYVDQIRRVAADMAAAGMVLVASEVVTFHRGDGWGGQFDAIWRTADDRHLIVDYKSRAAGKAAKRYPKEAAQLGGYASAEYWIVEDGDGPRRMKPLLIDGGLVVSIAPDDVRYYPVNIDHARNAWVGAVQWSSMKANTAACFGTIAKDLVAISGATTDRGGEPAHSDADETPAVAPTRPARIEPVADVDTFTVDEGKTLDVDATKAQLRAKAAELGFDNTVHATILNAWVNEGDDGRRPWRIHHIATERRRSIYGAAMRMAVCNAIDDDTANVLVGLALGEDIQPSMTLGMALGCLTIPQAATLVRLADLMLDGAELETLKAAA